MRNLSNIINHQASVIEYKASDKVVSPCLIGIELEVENLNIDKISKGIRNHLLWIFTGDGSLRNSGGEFVSVPLSGENVVNALASLDSMLKNEADSAQLTSRCSLHIHMDMRDISVRQLYNFLVVYTIFENSLFIRAGEHRKQSPYCVPITDSIYLQDLMSMLFGTDKEVHSAVHEWPKYSALNLRTLLRIGTVEFRMHPGTLDINEILSWINILLCIKKYIVNNPRKSTQSIIDSVCSGPQELADSVFNGRLLSKVDDNSLEHMIGGARIAQQVYRIRKEKNLSKKFVFNNSEIGRIPPNFTLQADMAALSAARILGHGSNRSVSSENNEEQSRFTINIG